MPYAGESGELVENEILVLRARMNYLEGGMDKLQAVVQILVMENKRIKEKCRKLRRKIASMEKRASMEPLRRIAGRKSVRSRKNLGLSSGSLRLETEEECLEEKKKEIGSQSAPYPYRKLETVMEDEREPLSANVPSRRLNREIEENVPKTEEREMAGMKEMSRAFVQLLKEQNPPNKNSPGSRIRRIRSVRVEKDKRKDQAPQK